MYRSGEELSIFSSADQSKQNIDILQCSQNRQTGADEVNSSKIQVLRESSTNPSNKEKYWVN